MQSLCLSSARLSSTKSSLAPLTAQIHYNRSFLLHHRHHASSIHTGFFSASVEPLRIFAQPCQGLSLDKNRRGCRVACHASMALHSRTLHWISAVSIVILMLTKGIAINKSYLVPLFALQAPSSVIGWIKGHYGAWFAFLALFVRLFFFIPELQPNRTRFFYSCILTLSFVDEGELEFPFMTLILIILAPYEAMNLRGSLPGTFISLAIAAYLSFQHFKREGSLQKAFSQGSLVATTTIILVFLIPLLLFI